MSELQKMTEDEFLKIGRQINDLLRGHEAFDVFAVLAAIASTGAVSLNISRQLYVDFFAEGYDRAVKTQPRGEIVN